MLTDHQRDHVRDVLVAALQTAVDRERSASAFAELDRMTSRPGRYDELAVDVADVDVEVADVSVPEVAGGLLNRRVSVSLTLPESFVTTVYDRGWLDVGEGVVGLAVAKRNEELFPALMLVTSWDVWFEPKYDWWEAELKPWWMQFRWNEDLFDASEPHPDERGIVTAQGLNALRRGRGADAVTDRAFDVPAVH